MTPSAAALAAALEKHDVQELPALPGRTNHLRTGVLVPLRWHADGIVAIATVRAASLRQHAGEVCFPGGRPEAGDADLAATALRETHEELGIGPDRVTILGRLSSIPLFTSEYRLRPFVAAIEGDALTPCVDEVAEVLTFEVMAELARSHIEAIGWSHEGKSGLSPIFRHGETIMYGATAHAFYELLEVVAAAAGGVAPPLEAGALSWQDVLRPGA